MNNDNPIIKGIGNIPEKFVSDVRNIIEQGRSKAYSSVNRVMIETYWNIGKRIVEEEQRGNERAEYGKMLIKDLSVRLTAEYGKGYSQRYLAYFRQFYLTIPDVMILQTRLQNLSWSHVLATLRVENETLKLEKLPIKMWGKWICTAVCMMI